MISSPPKGAQTPWKGKNTIGKSLKGFANSRSMKIFNVMNIPAAALDKLLGKFVKDVRKQNGGEYEPDSISSFQKRKLE